MFTPNFRLPILGAFLFTTTLGQLTPWPDDIQPELTQQQFRKHHDLILFTRFSPYDISADSNQTNAHIGISPNLYTGGAKEDVFMVHAWGSARVNCWSLLVEPVIVNNPRGQDILGTSFTRFGINGRIRNAFLRYTGHMVVLQIGRAPLFWGQSWTHSIVHTTVGSTYDHIAMQVKLSAFQFELFGGQLGSDTTAVPIRIKRLTAGHRLIWLAPSKKWILTIGEQVVYSGSHRSLELMYINPFIPYFFVAVEGDELTDPIDSDNSIIFFTGRHVFSPSLSLYGEFIVDDFQVDSNKSLQDQLGYRLGADGAFTIGEIPVTWTGDITKLNTWTNIHYGQSTSWYNRGHALGYIYGPDSWAVHLQGDAWLSKTLLADLDITWLSKGSKTLQSTYNNWHAIGTDPFPSEPVVNHTLVSASLCWWSPFGKISAGYSSLPFANHIAYDGLSKPVSGNFFFQYQYIFQKDFNI